MKLFSKLYEKVMVLSRHQHAPFYLGILSFAESSFFPIPPDVMLAPMSLAHPKKAFYFALITTITSVLGGIFGYFLGMYAFAPIVLPLIDVLHLQEPFRYAVEKMEAWDFWIIFIAGFSPIPYKAFTVGAGLMSLSFLPFVFASILGRGARFFLVAAFMRFGGKNLENKLQAYIDLLGWLMVGLILFGYIGYKLYSVFAG
jgi:membrane protein YqaA with SNARE-associated domain